MILKDFWLQGNQIDDNLLNQLGGVDSSGCALEPMKFVEYCLINL